MKRLIRAVLCLLAILTVLRAKADDTFVYAVQISAVVQTNPAEITLNWEPDPFGADSYTVYRKGKTDTSWGEAIVSLDGSITNYTDSNVVTGVTYEYQIIKDATLGYTGFGYIFSGILAPETDSRGTMVLVVATNSACGLSNELAQLETDLIGDGWMVVREDVSSNDAPQSVRSVIMEDYYADPEDVTAVFLFGHVPVLESGYLNYDGHYTRAMPADTYYAEMNDDWPIPDDPTNGPSYIPSDVVLEVGRVDFFNMPGQGAAVPWPSEQELLRNYLNKDHNWRYHLLNVQRQALMGDRRGDVDGPLAMAASGYRLFEPCVGPGNTIQANIQDDPPIPQIWISMLTSGNGNSYLWCFGDGGGEVNGVSYLGTNQPYNFVYSTDVVGVDAQAVFVMLFGSFMGNWDETDDILRSVLATPTMGLACCMSGEPHWFLHHMGLGETIGYGTRLTMNNSTFYQNESNVFTRAVYINLMGDPTLRMEPLAPPWWLTATNNAGSVTLTWGPSPDPVVGYQVFRSTSPAGPFTRLTANYVVGTSYTDASAPPGTYTYMVRAVQLEINPSGSYYNLSEGMTAAAAIGLTGAPPTFQLTIAMLSGTPVLSWDAAAGTTYHVECTTNPNTAQPVWTNISGPLVTSQGWILWDDTNAAASASRFYRVARP